MKRLFWYLQYIFKSFLFRDHLWGTLRLLFVAMVLAVASFLVIGPSVFLSSGVDWDRTLDAVRYVIWPAIGILVTLFLSGRYVQDIYDLRKLSLGLRYVLISFFGLSFLYPSIEIEKGKVKFEKEKDDLLNTVGGPGWLIVEPGSAVLLERLQFPSDVRTNGVYLLKRFEKVKYIIDLRVQHFNIKATSATSRDGLPITVTNIKFQYRILPNRAHMRTARNPYSFSTQAIKNLAYNRAVDKDGVAYWENSVKNIVSGVISDYISMSMVDTITAPRHLNKEPRLVIRDRIFSLETRLRLRGIGTELVWADIGHINPANKSIDAERLRAWKAKWNSRASVVRAHGEAQRFAYQELGRAETQLELLRGIANSLGEMELQEPESKKNNIHKIVLARTAQLLEAMTSVYQTSGAEWVNRFPLKSESKMENSQSSKSANGSREEKES